MVVMSHCCLKILDLGRKSLLTPSSDFHFVSAMIFRKKEKIVVEQQTYEKKLTDGMATKEVIT